MQLTIGALKRAAACRGTGQRTLIVLVSQVVTAGPVAACMSATPTLPGRVTADPDPSVGHADSYVPASGRP